MLQYLNILMADTSTSFCHYTPATKKGEASHLIGLDTLKAAIRFAMMENLMIQFVYPAGELPGEYREVIETIDHFNIKPTADEADVVVLNSWDFEEEVFTVPVVLRTPKALLFANHERLCRLLRKTKRLNIVITDVESFTEDDFKTYQQFLSQLAAELCSLYAEGHTPQLNLLTDRMMLTAMNNCGAGDTNVTLAPNGRFYACPAFYYDDEADSIGDLKHGLLIKNGQLYKREYAPICRHCDAWQCKRCVWLNRKTTLEVNTPSHEQCVVAHLERNASRLLQGSIRQHGLILTNQAEINPIDYLDPFEKRETWEQENL